MGLYDYDRISGVASLGAFFDQRVTSHEWVAAVGIRRLLDYVFNVAGLRKVHFEMPDSNQGSLRNLVERLPAVRAEGVLKGHVIASVQCVLDLVELVERPSVRGAIGADSSVQ